MSLHWPNIFHCLRAIKATIKNIPIQEASTFYNLYYRYYVVDDIPMSIFVTEFITYYSQTVVVLLFCPFRISGQWKVFVYNVLLNILLNMPNTEKVWVITSFYHRVFFKRNWVSAAAVVLLTNLRSVKKGYCYFLSTRQWQKVDIWMFVTVNLIHP